MSKQVSEQESKVSALEGGVLAWWKVAVKLDGCPYLLADGRCELGPTSECSPWACCVKVVEPVVDLAVEPAVVLDRIIDLHLEIIVYLFQIGAGVPVENLAATSFGSVYAEYEQLRAFVEMSLARAWKGKTK